VGVGDGSAGAAASPVAVDSLAAYTTACAFFGEQLSLVGDDDWDAATRCDGWDVRSLVAHVVLGEAMVVDLFNGGEVARAPEVDTSVLGPNPMATWRGTAVAALEAASVGDVLDRSHSHPSGDFIGTVILGFRATDNLIHGWDLATACGRQVELPVSIVERCLDFWRPVAGTGAMSGHFFEPVMPPEDAPAGVPACWRCWAVQAEASRVGQTPVRASTTGPNSTMESSFIPM